MGVRVGVSELWDDPMCELRPPLPRLALLPRHRLGWRCVAVVLRQWLYRQKGGSVPRRIVMGRLNRWVRLGVVILVASLSLGTATIAASASTSSTGPIGEAHVH